MLAGVIALAFRLPSEQQQRISRRFHLSAPTSEVYNFVAHTLAGPRGDVTISTSFPRRVSRNDRAEYRLCVYAALCVSVCVDCHIAVTMALHMNEVQCFS